MVATCCRKIGGEDLCVIQVQFRDHVICSGVLSSMFMLHIVYNLYRLYTLLVLTCSV